MMPSQHRARLPSMLRRDSLMFGRSRMACCLKDLAKADSPSGGESMIEMHHL